MTKHFLIHSDKRTGSHYLMTMLGKHPQITMLDEIIKFLIHPGNVGNPPPKELPFMKLRNGKPEEWFKAYRAYNYGTPVVGSVVHPWVLCSANPNKDKHSHRRKRILDDLLQFDWLIIELRRRNMLDTFISERLAHRTRRWGWWPDKGGPTHGKITFAPNQWYNYLERILGTRKTVCKAFAHYPTHLVWYEDLVNDQDAESVAAQLFLGVEPVYGLQPVTKKQERRPREARVHNWDVVVRTLTGTPWEGCLYDNPPHWSFN